VRNAILKMPASQDSFDHRLRLFVYQYFLRRERAPSVTEMARAFTVSAKQTRVALARLSESHAFMLQEDGELWRAAPFSAVPTAFPVRVGKKSFYGNCIWDALGIPAMLHADAEIESSCACCNLAMPLHVTGGRLKEKTGIVHFAVPACRWYEDVVFT
jgi:hypothetical protein